MMALKSAHPWTKLPFIVSAPMLGAATPRLAASVSRSGGFGFLAGGLDPVKLGGSLSETRALLQGSSSQHLHSATRALPIGIGFQLFNAKLSSFADVIAQHVPAAVWLFAPKADEQLKSWADTVRNVTNCTTKIWIQVGSVAEAQQSLTTSNPDVIIAQGNDAGGHGRSNSASIVSLVPEMIDALQRAGRSDVPVLAAGGIVEARGAASAIALGASGIVMGTRFLATEEAGIPMGWKQELLRTSDGGMSTVRSTLCDRLKKTKGWPSIYDGRAIRNQGHHDEKAGMSDARNIDLHDQELGQGDTAWGRQGRMVAYAGTGVGLIQETMPAALIMDQMIRETEAVLKSCMLQFADDDTKEVR